MSKVADFYAKAIADSKAKAKLDSILNGADITSATDAQLQEVGKLAKELGFDISLNEAKDFIKKSEELGEGDLDKVAGGFGDVNCKGTGFNNSGGSITTGSTTMKK